MPLKIRFLMPVLKVSFMPSRPFRAVVALVGPMSGAR
jgi:hypothetical protein